MKIFRKFKESPKYTTGEGVFYMVIFKRPVKLEYAQSLAGKLVQIGDETGTVRKVDTKSADGDRQTRVVLWLEKESDK